MAIATIDWVNAVVIPILLLVTIGLLLSVYAGLVASRAIAFYQARYKAVIWFSGLRGAIGSRHASPHDFLVAFSDDLAPLLTEFRALGHEDALQTLKSLVDGYLEAASQIAGVENNQNTMPQLPTRTDPVAAEAFMLGMRKYHLSHLDESIVTIAAIGPRVTAVLSLVPFPNYLTFRDKFIGLLTRRRSKLELIQMYLRGETTGWK